MESLKKSLWRVPLVCAGTGLLCRVLNFLIVFVVTRIRMAQAPDAPITVGMGLNTLLSALAFVLFWAAGWLFLRELTRKERFFSATLLVVFQLCLLAWEQIAQAHGAYPMAVYYLWAITESQNWLSWVIFLLTDTVSVPLAVAAQFTPYLYLLLPRKAA